MCWRSARRWRILRRWDGLVGGGADDAVDGGVGGDSVWVVVADGVAGGADVDGVGVVCVYLCRCRSMLLLLLLFFSHDLAALFSRTVTRQASGYLAGERRRSRNL